jgi:uncharacterized C2H2 Zn-finger protein
MNFKCHKCEKEFSRGVDLSRHLNRKTPCYKNLNCIRCGKVFTRLNHLNQHLNKKFPCGDKKLMLELELKLEQEKNKGKELDLKIINASCKKNTTHNINNINTKIENVEHYIVNQNITIYNIDQIMMLKPNGAHIANSLITRNNKEDTLHKMIIFQFNNPEHPENKCLIIKDDEIFSKLQNNIVNFKKVRPHFTKIMKDLCEYIPIDYEQFSEEEMSHNGWAQKKYYIKNTDCNTVRSVGKFIDNHRNDGYVNTVIKKSLC